MPELDTKAGIAIGAIIALIMGIFSQTIFAKQEQVIIQNGIPENSDVFNNSVCTYNIIQVSNGGGVNPSTIKAVNCKTGIVVSSDTNASAVFNAVMVLVNTNHGGDVHITGYSSQICCTGAYNITTAILIPKSGHLHLYGDSEEHVILKVPSCLNNDIFDFTYQSGLTDNAYFNHFNDFELWGNRGCGAGSTTSTGFQLNSTGFGIADSVFEQIFIRDFSQDDVYNSFYNSYANQWNDNTFEHAGRYCFYHKDGSDSRLLENKFLFCHGQYAIVLYGNMNSVSQSFFYKNDYNGILIGNFGSGSTISDNRFNDNGQISSNSYYDIILQTTYENTIVGNVFYGSDTANKVKAGISFNTNGANNMTIIGNSFCATSPQSFGTSPIVGVSGTGGNIVQNNVCYNPVGKVTNFVDGSNWTPFGTTSTVANTTTYTIEYSPVFTTVSGGTGVNVTMLDNNNNLIQKGLTTITEQYLPVGYKIKITFLTVPTVTVFFH